MLVEGGHVASPVDLLNKTNRCHACTIFASPNPHLAESRVAEGVMFLRPEARWEYLMSLPDSENIGRTINDAMDTIMQDNNDLRGVLPKQYHRFENDLLVSLMKTLNFNMDGMTGDVFSNA